jgi:uncharacterized protein (DUF1684 family)
MDDSASTSLPELSPPELSPPELSPPELSLADWRLRVAELYAEVRRLAATDPAGAHRVWRETRERLYREHPQSPVAGTDRGTFRARHFPYDQALRFEVRVEPWAGAPIAGEPAGPGFALPNSGRDQLSFRRIGRVTLPFIDRSRSLTLFWMEGYAGGLFLPFGDATNGNETYGAGRYVLDTAKGADLGTGRDGHALVVDFNFAFLPSCAFDPRWSCPLAPPENRLDLAVRAGERIA